MGLAGASCRRPPGPAAQARGLVATKAWAGPHAIVWRIDDVNYFERSPCPQGLAPPGVERRGTGTTNRWVDPPLGWRFSGTSSCRITERGVEPLRDDVNADTPRHVDGVYWRGLIRQFIDSVIHDDRIWFFQIATDRLGRNDD